MKEESCSKVKLRPLVVFRDAMAMDPGKKLRRVARNMTAEDDIFTLGAQASDSIDILPATI